MFANMEKLPWESSRDSGISTIFDFFCLIRITGFRIAEYGHTMQTKVDTHKYPSRNLVVKAFLPTDWVFKNEKGCLIKILPSHQYCCTKRSKDHVPDSEKPSKWPSNHNYCRQWLSDNLPSTSRLSHFSQSQKTWPAGRSTNGSICQQPRPNQISHWE